MAVFDLGLFTVLCVYCFLIMVLAQMFEAQKEWICPENFPDLKGYKYIAIDLETKDPDLKSRGSGAIIGNGNIVGIAIAVDGWSGYYPIAHEGGGNLEKDKVMDWIKSVCANDNVKIFHYAMYDVCWLRAAGHSYHT